MIRKNALPIPLISTPPHAHAYKRQRQNSQQPFNFNHHKGHLLCHLFKSCTARNHVTKITRKYTLYFVQNQI